MISTSAHGRVNLIGEHTDYNNGFVLPTGIPQMTRADLEPRAGQTVFVASTNLADKPFSFELGSERAVRSWSDYVQGATWVMRQEPGAKVCGFDLAISSTVPMGSGLSSSAALLVAVLRAIRGAWGLEGLVDDIRIARLAQKIENEFVGARVGIMDPLAASLATETAALFVDTQSLQIEQIPLPTDQLEVAVINSGISHSNVGGGYNQRRSECEQACEALGISSLREVGMDDLARIDSLPEPLRRRARHVVTENDRVLRAVTAIRSGDCQELGRLFRESHLSMKNDYEVSVPDIDTLVEIASAQPEVFGARLTGGGFGGSIVMIARAGSARAAAEKVVQRYNGATGRVGFVLVPKVAVDGTREITAP